MIPIGRGQRELFVGGSTNRENFYRSRHHTKSKRFAFLQSTYPIGQKASSIILEVYTSLTQRDSIYYLSLVISAASVPAVCQYFKRLHRVRTRWILYDCQRSPKLLHADDLSRHAVSYRDIPFTQKTSRPWGLPKRVFFVHSRLLERSAKLNSHLGGGSVTSSPVVETLAGDVPAYITTNVISITDGSISFHRPFPLRH